MAWWPSLEGADFPEVLAKGMRRETSYCPGSLARLVSKTRRGVDGQLGRMGRGTEGEGAILSHLGYKR